jgi:iron complex transport system permease protein
MGMGRQHPLAVGGALAVLTAMLVFVSLIVGYAPMPLGDVAAGLLGVGDERGVLIVQEIRAPRAVLSVIVGASLGLAGAVLQGLLRNPLAEPGLIGVSASAGFGAVIAFYFGFAAASPILLPVSAMSGALIAMAALLALSARTTGTLTLILAGIAISSIAVALTSLAVNLSPNPWALSEMIYWLMGSVRDRSFADVWLSLPFMAAGWLLLALSARSLDALSLGEEAAISLGVNLARLRVAVVVGATLSVGAGVAVAGAIGFVGLVVPHLLRPLVGHRPSALLLPSALGGAALLTAADIAVRIISSDMELYLGVVTSLIGAPFFLYLVFRTAREAPA